VYRGDFAFARCSALCRSSRTFSCGRDLQGRQSPSGQMNGYTYANMVAYYLLAMVGRAFSSMPDSSGIAREVATAP
jgi:ABC-2 type transport system permease protein